MNEFHYDSYAQEIVFGAGALDQFSEAAERLGYRRMLLCANRSMQAGGYVDSLKAILGDRLVAVFDRVQPHVQDVQLKEVLAAASKNQVDAFIGMGGGSPLGMAKAAAAVWGDESPVQAMLPVIAIPTTYAGSEMTPVYGITHTDERPPRKVTVKNARIVPKLVIYDPRLTLDLPPRMTASTGINALAHCIEALYSLKRNPISTAAAIRGVRHIMGALLRCYRDGIDLEARTEMLLGAHLAGLSLASVTMGLHHGLCHVLGGTAGVPHGIANSIILPYAIRFNADATATQLLPAAEVMGISIDATSPVVVVESMAEHIFELICQMGLPQRLRDAGVGLQESDLPQLAGLAFQNHTVQNNPKRVADVSQIEKLLREAW